MSYHAKIILIFIYVLSTMLFKLAKTLTTIIHYNAILSYYFLLSVSQILVKFKATRNEKLMRTFVR